MSAPTRVVLEVWPGGRIAISSLDDTGGGSGTRLAGRKFSERFGDPTFTATLSHQLDDRDVDGIREHLRDFDRIHGADDPAGMHALTEALDWYRHALRVPAEYRGLPHQVEQRSKRRAALVDACLALAIQLEDTETAS